MVIKQASLDIVCGVTSRIPDTGKVEIAFAGRSNVGKSSLINTLLNRKKLARTSSQPGKTQTINYYHVNESFYLVDLPGYGYANASVAVKEKWGKMVEKYFRVSAGLKAVFLLVDIRHEPSANDVRMFEWIKAAGYDPIVIATKADKIRRSVLVKHINMISAKLGPESENGIIAFSSETRAGKDEVWKKIEMLMN